MLTVKVLAAQNPAVAFAITGITVIVVILAAMWTMWKALRFTDRPVNPVDFCVFWGSCALFSVLPAIFILGAWKRFHH